MKHEITCAGCGKGVVLKFDTGAQLRDVLRQIVDLGWRSIGGKRMACSLDCAMTQAKNITPMGLKAAR